MGERALGDERRGDSGGTQIWNSRGIQIGDGTQFNITRIALHFAMKRTTIAALAILVAAVTGTVLYLKPWLPEPDLKLIGYEVAAPGTVDATSFEEFSRGGGPMERRDAGRTTIPATPVDITVKNNGSVPAVIVAAVVTVVFAERLEDCAQTGGPLQVAANYDVVLPAQSPRRPFSVTRGMRYEVRPKVSERFTLTIGPREQGIESWAADLYVAEVSLKLDYRTEPFKLGNVGLVSPAGKGISNLAQGLGTDEKCLRENASLMKRFDEIPSERSEEAATLTKRYQHLVRGDGGLLRPTCSDDGWSDSPAGVDTLCAGYAPGLIVVRVSLSGVNDTRPWQLVVGVVADEKRARLLIRCGLRSGDPPSREVALVEAGARVPDLAPCSDYRPHQSGVTLFAYPAPDLDHPTLRFSAHVLPADARTVDAVFGGGVPTVSVARAA